MAQRSTLVEFPARPDGVRPLTGTNVGQVGGDLTREYITINGYTGGVNKILGTTIDDVELRVTLETYERMENDPTISKAKRIIVNNVLADELQFAPGATEDEVGPDEYETYEQVMQFCQRVVAGLDKPFRETLEQLLGNGIRYGHGIAEIEFEYRQDGPSTKPKEQKDKAQASGKPARPQTARQGFFASWFSSATDEEGQEVKGAGIKRPSLTEQKTRLMPRSIMVKPRGAARFVVDDYMHVLGLVPRFRGGTVKVDEVIRRDKFIVFTMNRQDEDPRGRSCYRPAVNWHNIKAQLPAELLRYCLEEAVPKAVGTLPKDALPYEFERDQHGNIIYEDPETKKIPKQLTAAESMGRQIKGFRSGSGAVIPYEAKLEPFKKTGASDADFFPKILAVLDRQMEHCILLQTLAQSEGEHQARAASETAYEILGSLIFWVRWSLAQVVLSDLCETSVRVNLGDWALRYMPQISLGDFVRRDWARDLEVLAKAYFQGFLDDTQRPEIMAWLNLPKPGPSRAEVQAEADMNGEPVMPNKTRPDKQPGNNRRNAGNGTEKRNAGANQNLGRGPLHLLGHHGGRAVRFARSVYSRPPAQ
jgi:hypothetical protein